MTKEHAYGGQIRLFWGGLVRTNPNKLLNYGLSLNKNRGSPQKSLQGEKLFLWATYAISLLSFVNVCVSMRIYVQKHVLLL